MIVYNRIIPSNAMNSLLVLVSGLLILMIVDYIIRNVKKQVFEYSRCRFRFDAC